MILRPAQPFGFYSERFRGICHRIYGRHSIWREDSHMAFVTRPDRDRWDRDPEYIRNRDILRAQRRPCARCGGAIAYDEPYWLITINGRRKINPRAFHCGHIVSRIRGGSHALTNLQPEHAGCSIRSGASEGARRRHAFQRMAQPATATIWTPQLDESRRW